MKTKLDFADPLPRQYLSTLLYGPSGVGKSTAAASAPGPIIYCNADGPGALRYARRHHAGKEILELPITGRAPLEQLYMELRAGELDGLQTIALDSLGRIYDVILDEIANGGKPSLPQRGDANTFLERYVLSLLEMPVHLVLVAHDNPVVVTGKEEDGTQEIELFPHTGTGNPALAKKLMRPLDVVAYCGRTIEENDEGEQTPKFMAQTVKAGGRHAKDRTDVIGDFSELDLTDWIARVQTEYGTSDEKTNKKKEVSA
jgi:hypothetical protein